MAQCQHEFHLIKSPYTLIVWRCQTCHSGPHWSIYECKHCKLKVCRDCKDKD
ncbi:hypothetical protein BDY21DRAFT_292452 [Lineolata rhizophorae]|uniref:Phorbol-ester/DAG-type domain-containing protein n=1 Tax=Lineolata rhizophorae TaxID=578093 RepID=A0A6A6NPH9_9PEZI|nr:hypothetical protein BDY21DRAFT_292452 [Lineolata rhizophorae]